jgi:acyl carrier protein
MKNTYNELVNIILTQGIVGNSAMTPFADFQQDLHYKPADITELVNLTERTFNVRIPPEDYDQFSTLYDSTIYLKEKLQNK